MNHHRAICLARGAPVGTALEVAVHEGEDAFLSLHVDWNELFERAGQAHQVFQSFPLLRAWLRCYGGRYDRLVTITVRQDGRLVGALPLAGKSLLGIFRLQVMGAPVSQFSDALVDPAARGNVARTLLRAALNLDADLLELRRLRADSALRSADGGGECFIFESLGAPYACLATRVDGDQPGPAYSARERSNHRRRLRRLRERGELTLRSYGPGEPAASLALKAVELKRLALQRQRIFAPAVTSPQFARFFAELASDPDSGLVVSTIEIDGKSVGIDLSLLCKDVGFGHVLATEKSFEREGLGTLLIQHVLVVMKDKGAGVFDLLAPSDPYKLRHADGLTEVESRAYPMTTKGKWASNLVYKLALPAARWTAHRFSAITSSRSAKAGGDH